MTASRPELHVAAMREAIALAHRSIGLSEPNPRVGCVLLSADGRIIGRGHTQAAGGAHAEVMALRDAAEHGESTRGATACVTLEPCAHHGRTPPCCEALIAAGVGSVVLAVQDPNPLVDGAGIGRLVAAGIAVTRGLLAEEARALNVGFFSRMERGIPWLRMKAAVSLDGRSALADGTSQWITGTAARTDGHAWRKRAGALLTGVGTVIEDDPRLDVRLVDIAHQPLRVIVDSRLETPPAAHILDAPGRVLVYAAKADEARAAALVARGAEIVLAPSVKGKVDLVAMLDDLAQRGVNELHVEAGEKLNGSLIRAGLVDELLVYVAPTLLGAGRGLAAVGPFESLAQGVAWRFVSVAAIGEDLRIVAQPA